MRFLEADCFISVHLVHYWRKSFSFFSFNQQKKKIFRSTLSLLELLLLFPLTALEHPCYSIVAQAQDAERQQESQCHLQPLDLGHVPQHAALEKMQRKESEER